MSNSTRSPTCFFLLAVCIVFCADTSRNCGSQSHVVVSPSNNQSPLRQIINHPGTFVPFDLCVVMSGVSEFFQIHKKISLRLFWAVLDAYPQVSGPHRPPRPNAAESPPGIIVSVCWQRRQCRDGHDFLCPAPAKNIFSAGRSSIVRSLARFNEF
jgi:hypothetical protein